jgi:subtilisin
MVMLHGCARSFRALGAVLILLAIASPLSAQGTEEYIVQFREGVSVEARGAAAAAAGASVRRAFAAARAMTMRVPNEQALAALQQHPMVASVVPNRPVSAIQGAQGKPVGPGGGSPAQVTPAGITRVGAPAVGSDGSGVGVAVLDTGVDLSHPDLAGTIDAFSAFGSSCQDDQGHGTHVAGTIAARDNTIGVIGVAPAATIYCVKVLDNTGGGSDDTVMAGLEWVYANRDLIRVVNMSLGRPGSINDNPAQRDLIALLNAAGITIIVAAGNDPALQISQRIPAAYPEVAAVASTTALGGSNQCRVLANAIASDTASYFTTDGAGVAVSAPGEDREDVSRGCRIQSVGILSTRLGGGTTRMSGTSMAAPHVAGIAARYYQQNPVWDAETVRFAIANGAVRKGTAPLNSPSASYSFDGLREGIAQAP